MSQFYTVILFDDFDFDYVGRNKEQTIKFIQEEFIKLKRRVPEVSAEWLKHIVFDLCAVYPDVEIQNILLRYCDSGVWYSDESPYKKEEMVRDARFIVKEQPPIWKDRFKNGFCIQGELQQ